jgi:deazaflavin-dependent oxidoreductase (nitroreductase family)
MAVADDLDRASDSRWDWVAEHTRLYLDSGGTTGHEANGVHNLVLATTGRRTGEPRRTTLIYGTSGDDFVVVASKGGADDDPEWFKNLRADPSVGVQVGTRRFTARARVATPADREPLWARMVGIFPLYDAYARRTERVIPIVLLTPRTEHSWVRPARARPGRVQLPASRCWRSSAQASESAMPCSSVYVHCQPSSFPARSTRV